MKNLLFIACLFATFFTLNAQVTYKGLVHNALGQASVETVGGKLIVSNCGESGNDGVSIEMNNCTTFGAAYDPVSIPRNGDMLYTASATQGGDIGLRIENVEGNEKQVSMNFGKGDVLIIEGYLRGRKIYEDQMNVIGNGSSRIWPLVLYYVLDHADAHFDISHTSNSDGSSSTTYSGGLSWNGIADDPGNGGATSQYPAAEVRLENGAVITVDYVKVSSVAPGRINSVFTDVSMTATNFDGFTITDEASECEHRSDNPELPNLQTAQQLQSLGNTYINVFPNPFSTEAKVDFQLDEKSNINIDVYNMAGQRVSSLVTDGAYEAGRHSLDLGKDLLGNGVFLIKMRTEKTLRTTKIMIAE
ncbi:MAG: T9SS type A sorting domain-containing protein [Bacteroidota bacterium]